MNQKEVGVFIFFKAVLIETFPWLIFDRPLTSLLLTRVTSCCPTGSSPHGSSLHCCRENACHCCSNVTLPHWRHARACICECVFLVWIRTLKVVGACMFVELKPAWVFAHRAGYYPHYLVMKSSVDGHITDLSCPLCLCDWWRCTHRPIPHYTSHLSCPDPFQGFICTLTVSFTQQSMCIKTFLISGSFTMRKTEQIYDHGGPLAITHAMFSHQVEKRKWAYDKSPVISTLYVIVMDRFYLSHLSAAETQDIFLEDGKLLDKGKKSDSGAFFADCVNIHTMAFFSWQDIRYLHICWIPCRLLSAALYLPSCSK